MGDMILPEEAMSPLPSHPLATSLKSQHHSITIFDYCLCILYNADTIVASIMKVTLYYISMKL